jgi:hypothetical protein
MHGRVIRPSLVEVAKAPQQTAAKSDEFGAGTVGETVPEPTSDETAERIADQAEIENTGP